MAGVSLSNKIRKCSIFYTDLNSSCAYIAELIPKQETNATESTGTILLISPFVKLHMLFVLISPQTGGHSQVTTIPIDWGI